MEVPWCGLTLALQAALALSPHGWPAHPVFYKTTETPHTHRLLFSLLKFYHSQSSDCNWCFILKSMFSYHFSSAVYSPFAWGTNKKAKRSPNTICINLLAGSQFLLNIATMYFGFNRTFLKLKASREVSGFWTKHFLPSWKQQQETNSSGQKLDHKDEKPYVFLVFKLLLYRVIRDII